MTEQSDQEVFDKYNKEKPWGMNVSIDLHECDPDLIKDPDHIKKFITDLVKFIDMKAYGDPIVVDFGDDPIVSGYSAMQLIETSDITAHFANKTNRAYIDIFSCKPFYPYKSAEFCKQCFKAADVKVGPVRFRH